MKLKLVIRAVAIAGLLLTGAVSTMVAGTPIRLTFRDTTIASGRPLSYAIYVDSSLSGYSVKSYQIQFTYNHSYFTFTGATATGTIASAWGAPTVYEVTPGTINIAAAGSDTLAGTGKLVILNFTSNLFTSIYNYSEYGYFTFQAGANTVLNQGSPSVDFHTGTVTLTPGPSITVSPNTALLTKGDVVQFSASGGHGPYGWVSTSPSVASIDTLGKLTGLGAGFTKVVAIDSNGYVDTSGVAEVRAFKLSLHDTSCYQGQIMDVPIYCTSLTGLGITAGQLNVTFDQSRWSVLSTSVAGGLLASYTPASFSVSGGTLSISFAGTSPLSGSGALLYVRLKASSVNYGNTTLAVQNGVFNQDLVANVGTSNLNAIQLVPVIVSPSYAQTLVVGDSIQFTATGGTPPYTWSASGTGQATISQSGWLKATRSGMDTVTATDGLGSVGKGGPVSIYDFRLSVPDTSLIPNSYVDVPIYVSPNSTGFSSVQLGLSYTTGTYVHLDSIVTTGTLSGGMTPAYSINNGVATIALAGTNKVYGGGVLLKLRFGVPDSTPRPSTSSVTVTSALFNEGIPLALIKSGSFQIANRAIISIAPGSAALHTTVGQMDSVMFTVYNSGTANLTSSIYVNGPSVFTISTNSINVLPADSAKVAVYFQPLSAGPASATIQFNTNDPYHSTVNVPVTGVTPYPILAFSVASINFGTVKVGQYKDTTVTISNTGTDTLKITNIAGSLSFFSARPTTANILPGNSIVDTIRFTPSAGGVTSARISVTSNSLSSPDTVGVLGTGSVQFPILLFSSNTVSFGSVKVGSFKDTAITITNTGTDTLKISNITTSNSVFSARPTLRKVAPGQSFLDTLRFTPAATGGYTGRIFVVSNAPTSPDTITVSGTGTPATDVSDLSLIPGAYALDQNFPNPFNPSTIIRYGLRSRSTVRLVIFNILGQKVDELVNGEQGEGYHAVTWNPSVPSGAYFYRIEAVSKSDPNDHFTQIRKMILMK
jgi:hypothetical protein